MSIKHSKSFWLTGLLLGLTFFTLMAFRLDLIDRFNGGKDLPAGTWTGVLPERDTWMIIYQNGNKIGYSHKTFLRKEKLYRIQEKVFMRIKTMGMVQNLRLKTTGYLHDDLSLSRIDFNVSSGLFSYSVYAYVSGGSLMVKTTSSGDSRDFSIKLKKKPYLAAGIVEAVRAAGPKTGDKFSFDIFDPATMGQAPVEVHVMGKEDILNMGKSRNTTRLSISFKGSSQKAWIDVNGDIIREEGLLGISLERADQEKALASFSIQPGQDLTQTVSLKSNIRIKNKDHLKRLAVKITGIDNNLTRLNGGRQVFKDDILTVNQEPLTDLPKAPGSGSERTIEKKYLSPDPFIQSDHPKIKNLVRVILRDEDTPLNNARKIMGWIHRNIKRQPVISLPDALSTFENRVGDCNEHAVLFAALLRAAGIPARIETGLVYLRGRFYYHAWNLIYVGKWVTADSVFNQVPSDVTHIRFTSGSQNQLDLMGIIGKVKLEVVAFH